MRVFVEIGLDEVVVSLGTIVRGSDYQFDNVLVDDAGRVVYHFVFERQVGDGNAVDVDAIKNLYVPVAGIPDSG